MADKKPLSPFERGRRSRNIALGLVLVGLVVLFFTMTMVRMGAQVGG